MFRKMVKTSILLILILSLGFTALAQQQQPSKPSSNDSQWVDFSGFKGKVFDIKNREPRDLVPTLRPLGSGFKGAVIEANPDFKTITVRDFPENLAAIEEAIKRLDVPLPPRPARPAVPSVEIYGYILLASNAEGASAPFPNNIKDVLPQLSNTLNYKNYQLLSSIVQRTSLSNGRIESSGGVTPPDKVFNAR
ncbi:MAG: secretin N-terminal domain-containing protein, partial [Blastocatellia bacterium]